VDPSEQLIDSIFGLHPRPEILPLSRRGLRALAAARAALDGLEAELVAQARRDAVTWALVGADLGIPPTTLRGRYSSRPAPARGLPDGGAGK
jgi:hypothetical protein